MVLHCSFPLCLPPKIVCFQPSLQPTATPISYAGPFESPKPSQSTFSQPTRRKGALQPDREDKSASLPIPSASTTYVASSCTYLLHHPIAFNPFKLSAKADTHPRRAVLPIRPPTSCAQSPYMVQIPRSLHAMIMKSCGFVLTIPGSQHDIFDLFSPPCHGRLAVCLIRYFVCQRIPKIQRSSLRCSRFRKEGRHQHNIVDLFSLSMHPRFHQDFSRTAVRP